MKKSQLHREETLFVLGYIQDITTICGSKLEFFNFKPHVTQVSTNHKRVNHLTPNYPYSGRTAPLTSKRCILYIYSTNIGTEYFKHVI